MQNDMIYNKIATIERCINRIRDEYQNDPENLNNYTKQDAIILNIQKACEACIDIAMYMISVYGWGIPQRTRDGFEILYANSIIDNDLCRKLKAMVGFRNIAVHDYQELNMEIIKSIIENNLEDFISFKNIILASDPDQ
jgi:uncharacterized protein YutE (UPF0331/DUF86 family)